MNSDKKRHFAHKEIKCIKNKLIDLILIEIINIKNIMVSFLLITFFFSFSLSIAASIGNNKMINYEGYFHNENKCEQNHIIQGNSSNTHRLALKTRFDYIRKNDFDIIGNHFHMEHAHIIRMSSANSIYLTKLLDKNELNFNHLNNISLYYKHAFSTYFINQIISTIILWIGLTKNYLKKMPTYICLLLLLNFNFLLFPDNIVYGLPFTNTWNGPNYETFCAVCDADNGGFYLAGDKAAASTNRGWLAKVNSLGSLVWEYINTCGYISYFGAVAKLSNDGCIVAGKADSDCHDMRSGDEICMMKFNPNNAIPVWTKYITEIDPRSICDIRLSEDEGFVLIGELSTYAPFIVRADSNGNRLWHTFETGLSNKRFTGVEVTPSGGFIGIGSDSHPCLFIRYSSNGYFEHIKSDFKYKGRTVSCEKIRKTSDGKFIISGGEYEIITQRNSYMAKVNIDGEVSWETSFGDVTDDRSYDFSIEPSGYILGMGIKIRAGGTNEMIWVFVLNLDGKLIASREYGDNFNNANAYSIVTKGDGSYTVAGRIFANAVDAVLIINSFGCYSGTFYNAASKVCEVCPPGHIQPDWGKNSCIECNPGYYQYHSAQTDCDPCPINTYQPDNGKMYCLECEKGKFQDAPGQTFCKECNPGYYYDIAKLQCEKCNELCLTCNGPSSKECIACDTTKSIYVEDKPNTCVVKCDDDFYYKDLTTCKSINSLLSFSLTKIRMRCVM